MSNLIPVDIPRMAEPPVSRLAPTPSGFLHLGNAVNFLVTWALVRRYNGRLHLRIDDMDGIRFRRDVLEDIFASLDWLGLDWDTGPEGPDEFLRHFSLQDRREIYRSHLARLNGAGGCIFNCGCSRKDIRRVSADGRYPRTCRDSRCEFIPGRSAVRLKVDGDSRIKVNSTAIDLEQAMGDFVVWRKDDQPSYHLASLVEDESSGINFIVRGEDLLESTAAQIYLAGCLGFSNFPRIRFIHHGLVTGADGKKLSKSRGAFALKDMRASGSGPEKAFRAAARLLGIPGEGISAPGDLVARLRS